MIKLGILGGTFDPFHLGHLLILRESMKALSLDRAVVEPNFVPYYREQPVLSGEERLEICRLSVSGMPGVEVSDREIRRGVYTPTYSLLRELRAQDPDTAPVFIIGMDSFLYLHTWKNGPKIPESGNLAVLKRPGYNLNPETLPPELRAIYEKYRAPDNAVTAPSGQIFFLDTPETDISATRIRNLLRTGNLAEASKFLAPAALPRIGEILKSRRAAGDLPWEPATPGKS